VTAALKAAGYKVIFYPSIFPDLDGFPADVRVAGSGNMKSLIFDDELMKRTPIRSAESLLVALRAKAMGPGTRTGWIPTYGHALALHVARTQEAFKAVGTETRSSTPLFVMVHIVCPHPPFVFVGKDWQQKIDYSATNDVLGRDLTREQFIAGYRGQVEYTNTRMHEVVDRLLARPGPRPIIIVQGDHGPNLGRIDNREIMVPHERMSILDAYYVPENIRGNLYPTITPVNSFRIILNGLLGTNYEKVADDSYAPSASVTGGLELYREGAPAGSTPVQSQSGGAPVWKAD
jgi:hypothetical protein